MCWDGYWQKVQVKLVRINPVRGMNPFGLALGSELIIDLKEWISYDRKVTALTRIPCGGVVVGKLLQVHMARINPHPLHESFWAWSWLRTDFRL